MTTAFGLLLPTREAVMNAAETPDFGRILELAERAEAVGFDSVWVGDSILSRPRFEPLTTLAAVAARTRSVRLGTAVLVPIMRHPVVLANEVANVDVISGGRLILGMGVGGAAPTNLQEMANVGRPFEHRGARLNEEVGLMSRLWAGEEVTQEGRYVEVDHARLGFLPVQRPRPPVWFGGNVESTFRRVVRLGDGWFPNATGPEVVVKGWERITALAAEAGRDPSSLHRAVYLTLAIDEDEGRADQQMASFMESYYGRAYEAVARTSGLCAGSPERCAKFIDSFIAVGVETVVVRFGSPDQTGQLDRWTQDVRPLINDA
jgi:probable F420-dependent oxidoreductase